jgi:hypothetical protein
MLHELRENRLANVHPPLSTLDVAGPDRLREPFLARKSSNRKISKTQLTRTPSELWREFKTHVPDSSEIEAKLPSFSPLF